MRTQSKQASLFLCTAALCLMAFAAPAAAAPTLKVEATHSPSTVHRGDEYLTYAVTIKNDSPAMATCDVGSWTGAPTPTLAYQWLRDGASLGSANGAQTATYSPQPADVGHSLQCQVTGINTGATSIQVSAPLFYGQTPTTVAPAPSNPTVAAARPTIEPAAGNAAAGAILTCKAPTNWNGNPSWTFEWLRNGTPAVGTVTETTATTSKYEVAADDIPGVLQCKATATNPSGTAIAISSNKNAGAPATPPVPGVPTTSGAEWVSSTTSLHLAFPSGVLLDGIVSGSGWSCLLTASVCSNSSAAAPGQSLPALTVGVHLDPDVIPDKVSTTFTVFGGGSSGAIGQHSFTLATPLSFGLVPGSFAAGACFAPPEAVTGTVDTTDGFEDLTAAASAEGAGTLTNGEAIVTDLTTSAGAFEVGQLIFGTGIPDGTTIEAIDEEADTLELSAAATADGAQDIVAHGFTVGLEISGPGIPVGATITAVDGRTLTISPQATATASGVAVTATAPLELPTAACNAASAGSAYTQAGGHPFIGSTSLEFITKRVKPNGEQGGDRFPFHGVRELGVSLPPGFVANTTVVAGGCTLAEVQRSVCPERYAVGRAFVQLNPGFLNDQQSPIYKIQTEKGYPAAFAVRPVNLSEVTVVLRARVRASDFTVTAYSPRPSQGIALEAVRYFSFCSYGAVLVQAGANAHSPRCKQPGEPGAFSKPFFTNPTRCDGGEDITSVNVASYQNPGRFDSEGFPDTSDPNWKSYESASPPLTDCSALEFEPSFEGRPTTGVADQPSGFNFTLNVPQHGLVGKDEQGNLDPDALATPHLKRTTVVLPEGLVVNPSSATGLEACSTEQMGLTTIDHPEPYPIRFDGSPVRCPNGSKLGTVEVSSPLVDEILTGGFYLAEQDDPRTTTPGAENPFDSTLAAYLAIRNDELGVSAKLAGEISVDRQTGRITTTFDNNPQLPFDTLRLRISEGPRASLRTPAVCGPKMTSAEYVPWSFPDTSPAEVADSYSISTPAPEAGSCPTSAAEIPSAPRFTAGTESPTAGAYSPFVLRLSRPDGTRELTGLEATLPPGLTGRLAGVPYCSEADIAKARSREAPRKGSLELTDPSCPVASALGDVEASAGAGPLPYRTGGKAYLAGPYKGAPISLVAIVPAVAGPFDLGNVVVRTALHVDPVTAQVSAKSDPFPTIIEGIPLDVRSVEVKVDRPEFTLNPTNCDPLAFSGKALLAGAEASLSERFQVGDCARLAFKPTTRIQLFGGVSRAKYQGVRAVVRPRPGDANISGTVVRFPSSAFVAQEHLQNICTRVQWAADACPKNSVYGTAIAYSPLLDEPLRGKVHLRSSNNLLPDVVADLRGPAHQPIKVEVAIKTDSVKGALRNTVQTAPDAPVTFFRLQIFGGKKALIRNSANICRDKNLARVTMRAHNGRRSITNVPARNAKCKKWRQRAKQRKAVQKRKRMIAKQRAAQRRSG